MKNAILKNFLSIFLEIDRIIFWHLAKIFPQSCQNYFLSVQTNTLIKIFFLKNTSSYCFQTLSATFFDSRRKVYRKLSKLFSTRSEKNLKLQIFSNCFFCFWYVFGVWAKSFWHLAKTIPQSWHNCFLGVQTNTLIKKRFNFFFKIGGHFFSNFSKNIPQRWRNCFYAFRRTLWWKTIF